MKKLINKITNGIIIIFLGILHTQFALSADGFGTQFWKFSETYFFKISSGLDEFPADSGIMNFEVATTFWFFYFGLLLFPLGLLVHFIEKKYKILPHSFTISYLIVILIGCYMIPNSGMTVLMLPHGLYLVVRNYLKARKLASPQV